MKTSFVKERRGLALFLALLIMLTAIPFHAFVKAEEAFVTVSVVDQEGSPVKDATIDFNIIANQDIPDPNAVEVPEPVDGEEQPDPIEEDKPNLYNQGDVLAEGQVTTDDNGRANVLSMDKFFEDALDFTYLIGGPGVTSKSGVSVLSLDNQFSVEVLLIKGVNQPLVDGKAPAFTLSRPLNDNESINFTIVEKPIKPYNMGVLQKEIPIIQSAGEYRITVEIMRDNIYKFTEAQFDSTIQMGTINLDEIDWTLLPNDEDYSVAKQTTASIPYDGQEHDAIQVNLPEWKPVPGKYRFRLPGDERPIEELFDRPITIPKVKSVGEYTFDLIVQRYDYHYLVQEMKVTVTDGVMADQLNASTVRSSYDGQAKALLAFSPSTFREGDQIYYTITKTDSSGGTSEYASNKGGEPLTIDDSFPTATDIGFYKIDLEVKRNSFVLTKAGFVEPTYDGEDTRAKVQKDVEMSKLANDYAIIAPASLGLAFNDEANKAVNRKIDFVDSGNTEDNTYSFEASTIASDLDLDHKPEIKYSFKPLYADSRPINELVQPKDGTATKEELEAGIDSSEIVVLQATAFTVTAYTIEEDGSIFYPATVSVNVFANRGDFNADLIKFVNPEIEYTLSKTKVVSKQQVQLNNQGMTEVLNSRYLTYSFELSEDNRPDSYAGLSIDPVSGQVTISDYDELGQAMFQEFMQDPDNFDGFDVTVIAHRAGQQVEVDGEVIVFALEEVEKYNLKINYGPIPTQALVTGTAYSLSPVSTNGWYTNNEEVSVRLTNSNPEVPLTYTIGHIGADPNKGGFTTRISFKDPTPQAYGQVLSNNGKISAPFAIKGVRIDNEAPFGLEIDYAIDLYHGVKISELTDPITLFYNKALSLGSSDGVAVITFYAEDLVSGVKGFDYAISPSDSAKASDNELITGAVPATRIEGSNRYTGQLTLPLEDLANLQYNGKVSFKAKDEAGLLSDLFNDADRGIVVIVDTLNPEAKINYYGYQINKDYDGAAANPDIIYSRDFVAVEVEMKEANFYPEDIVVEATKDGQPFEFQEITWMRRAYDELEDRPDDDLHFGSLRFHEDGTYTVDVHYTDRSKNEMTSLSTKTIIIDNDAPEYTMVLNEDNSTTFVFTEKNFVPGDIVAEVTANRLDGTSVEHPTDVQTLLREGNWETEDGLTHRLTISDYVDGIYSVSVSYTDPAGNVATQQEPIRFTQDTRPPSEVAVSYSQSVLDTTIGEFFYRFYHTNPGVTINFRASDDISGVDHFQWRYVKLGTASGINRPTLTEQWLSAAPEAGGVFASASVQLPGAMTGDYHGHIEVRAVDGLGNVRETYTVENVNRFVVDGTAPTVTASYTEPVRTFNGTSYYDGPYTATYTINEANFYPEDVYLYLSRNDGTRQRVSVNWTTNGDNHTASYPISEDGIYQLTLEYRDRSGNAMPSQDSGRIIVDTVDPLINVSYNNNAAQSSFNGRDYYNASRTATVTITERNFNASDVELFFTATDVGGQALNVANFVSSSNWSSAGDTHTMTINYPGDANYSFDIAYSDLANNAAADYAEDNFAVDAANPTDLTVNYSGTLVTALGGYAYYNSPVTVTISATDNVAGVEGFEYSYINTANVSSVNGQLINQALSNAEISYSNGGRTATATFTIPRGALGLGNQFNGNVEFTARDRSQNSSQLQDGQRLIVDNISPTSNISYNEADAIDDEIHYYAKDIVATVEINEANFDQADVVINLTKDGAKRAIQANWTSNSTDHHVGTFTISGDGRYLIEIAYRDKSGNAMTNHQSNTMLIDTVIEQPIIKINGEDGDGKAFQGDVVPSIQLIDLNFDRYALLLTRDRYGVLDEDVTEEFLAGGLSLNEEGASATFDNFKKIRENDGIYTLSVTMVDKAGNSSTETITFSVNRFGSVYKYGTFLSKLIANGGQTVKQVDEDIELLEVNPNQIKANKVKVEITRDGKPLDDVLFDIITVDNRVAGARESGWYEYRYVISKDNFKEDGVYKITISSEDEAGNTPENASQNQEIIFTVDHTPPEITSITGLEDPIIDASEQVVNFIVFDALGLKSIKIYVNGELVDEITDFEDPNNYSGSFTLYEKADIQNIRLVVEDQAGNITDTADDDFVSAFSFNSNVTLSTNLFVRLQANPTLLWGLVAAITAAVLLIIFFILLKKRKDKEETPSEAA